MIPFDPLLLGSSIILAAANPVCDMPRPTKINVNPKALETKYDYSQSLAELQNYEIDTVDPHSFGGMSTTQGFMSGGITMRPKVKLGIREYPSYGAVCVWYDQIDIELEIDPTIVIAREVYNDPCMRKTVIGHELKHVRVDREIVNKYAQIIGKKVYDGLKARGFKSGLVKSSYLKDLQERMHKTVVQIVDHEYKKMDLERVDLQRAVDNLQEYQRVQAACPHFKSSTYLR